MLKKFIVSGCAAVCLLAVSACSIFSPPEPQRRIFFNAEIWTCDPANPVARAMVVEDGKIIYIGNRTGAYAFIRGNSSVEYLNGEFIIPGFVVSGDEVSRLLKAETASEAGRAAAANELLKNYASRGITTVFDLDEAVLPHLRAMEKANVLPLRCFAAHKIALPPVPAEKALKKELKKLREAETELQEDNPSPLVRTEYVKLSLGDKNLCRPEELAMIGIAAAEYGFDLHIASDSDLALDTALAAADQIGAKNGRQKTVVSSHPVLTPESVCRMSALKNAVYIADPVLDEAKNEELESGAQAVPEVFPPVELMERGVPVLLRGDSQRSLRPLDGINAVLNYKGRTMRAQDVVAAYTLNGAKMLNAEKESGSLTVGKNADFVMLDRNIFKTPKEELKNIRILRTYFNGRTVYLRPQHKAKLVEPAVSGKK